jgi:hypothetical protein
MFAEPEMLIDTEKGQIHQQALVAAKGKVALEVYEVNIGTTEGTVGQAALNTTIPSLGAGLSTVDQMLLMLRDLGVYAQCIFQLGGISYHFENKKTHEPHETSPVWPSVVDMGGATDRVKPVFLAEQIANDAILPTMLTTSISGTNPTWDQPLSTNGKVHLDGAHELQTFAFTDGKKHTLILLNLSRTSAHAVRLEGNAAPHGTVNVELLTSAQITDGNDNEDKVRIAKSVLSGVVLQQTPITLPPFSMTVLSSDAAAHP